MKKYFVKQMIATFAIWGIVFIHSILGVTNDTVLLPYDSEMSLWKADDSNLEVEINQKANKVDLLINTSGLEENYEQFVVNMVNEDVFALNAKAAIKFDYNYSGENPIYLGITLNAINGSSISLEDIPYEEIINDKKYLCQMNENGQINLRANSKATLILPLNKIKQYLNNQQFYGVTFTMLVQKQEQCHLEMSSITKTIDPLSSQITSMDNVSIKGSDIIVIPYMGTYWYDYSTQGKGTLISGELAKGCTLGDDGRLIVEENAESGTLMLEAKINEQLYMYKMIELRTTDNQGMQLSKPEQSGRITYPLEFLGNPKVVFVLRVILGVIIVNVLIIAIWIQLRIYRQEKKDREEELF